jgi:hypothetical protein
MLRMTAACRWLVLLAVAAVCLVPATVHSQSRSKAVKGTRDVSAFRKQYAELRLKFTDSLLDLARVCDEQKNLPDVAARIRELAAPIDDSELRLIPLPREVQQPLKADLPVDERFWRTQLRSRQQDFAKDLYVLSRRALDAGHVSFSIDLVREVLLHDSDHPTARKILGFVRNNNRDEWVSAFEKEKLKRKEVWTDQFGWLPRDSVDRYQRGERFYNRRWISAASEAEIRHEFSNAWEVRTEHYLVKTNHSLERGVEVARKLEDFHGLFFQMMAGFFNSAADVEQLIAGRDANPMANARKQNVVHYYRSRDEYIAALKTETTQPIEITRGIFFPRNMIAYFFYDPDSDDDSTLYHEATHQLLSGSRPMTGEIGIKSDFWIIEGIACYMESFRREGDRFSVGDPSHIRLRAARMHYLEEDFFLPLRELSRMGMIAFQGIEKARLGKIYSQGAALTHFFMHYEDGRYREALIEYLSQIYSPTKAVRENPDSLEVLTGVSSEVLDRQYADYIRKLLPPESKRREPGSPEADAP